MEVGDELGDEDAEISQSNTLRQRKSGEKGSEKQGTKPKSSWLTSNRAKTSLLGLETFFADNDVENFADTVRQWFSNGNTSNGNKGTGTRIVSTSALGDVNTMVLVSLILVASALSVFFSSFVVLVPCIHGIGGYFLHHNEGWTFYQPGIGGPRFVALNGVSWTFYAITVVLHVTHMALGDFTLYLTAFVTGLLSLSFVISSLFAYQNNGTFNGNGTVPTSNTPELINSNKVTRRYSAVEVEQTNLDEYEQEYEEHVQKHGKVLAPEFSEKLQRSVIMLSSESGANPSGLWWVFITLQLSLAFSTAWILTIVNGRGDSAAPVKVLTSLLATCSFLGCIPVTHAIGGKWKNIRTSYTAFQPGIGGVTFVALQALGWTLYSFTFVLGLIATVSDIRVVAKKPKLMPHLMLITALTGLASELLIFSSLFFFRGNDLLDDTDNRTSENPLFGSSRFSSKKVAEIAKANKLKRLSVFEEDYEPTWVEKLLDSILSAVVGIANLLFGPGGNLELNTREPEISGPNEHLKADAKWNEAVKHITATGDQYLVVGCGFVGKRLVHRLLQRGETRIRVFDIVPVNPFENVPEIEFIRGDVTKISDIGKACEGVDTIYATFALIRFMDRLEHQVKLSYHVNVVGTKVMFEAAKANRVKRVIVTSSSHATTDEFSKPRMNRTENAPYVTRETAHNHYGWTKALADQYALAQNSEEMKVIVLRPCSGVFGGDDRTSFEKCLDLGVAPGIGSFCIMDWVYVENVVLGHLLGEYALQANKPNAAGEAFNISNNDATTWMDFWFLVKKICKLSPKKVSSKVKIEFCFVPMSVIWITAYFSEFMQRVFKGKISLGKDVDTLTPAMLSTASMSYSYKSEKAKKYLGYEPVFTLDEGVQRSVYEYYRVKYEKKPLF